VGNTLAEEFVTTAPAIHATFWKWRVAGAEKRKHKYAVVKEKEFNVS
jgi:hypothetical protein